MKHKLHKLMAQAGYGSRRSAETMIKNNRVVVNNKIAQIGIKVSVEDSVILDGRKINLSRYLEDKTRVLILNKQAGIICSNKDDKGRKTVFKLLPKGCRWIMVGRLDINTSGLLLFTNNGELARRLMHPSFAIVREYLVRVLGKIEKTHTDKLLSGVKLVDGISSFDKVNFIGGGNANSWYKVSLTRGKNREVRRLWESLGFKVSRLIRVRYGSIILPNNMRAKQIDYLSTKQVNSLLKSVGIFEKPLNNPNKIM